MRAFLSYSLNDSEQYVLSILVNKLNEKGFTVSSSYSNYNFIDFERFNQINSSNLFIGVITATGTEYERVYKEWETASAIKVPALLLVENTVQIHPNLLKNTNVILFDRHNPSPSIDLVKSKISQNTTSSDNFAAWALGGLAVLALIGLLSDSKK